MKTNHAATFPRRRCRLPERWFLLLFLIFTTMTVQADDYTSLWKQYQQALDKDLPQTQRKILGQIADKASGKKDYGHLLAAELRQAALQTEIAPDSFDVEIARIGTQEKAVRESDPVLAAIYESVLGYIWKEADGWNESEENQKKSEEYYRMSLSRPDLLAATRSDGYTPLLDKGADSKIFDNDLLHVLAMEAGDWQTMRDYYKRAGRPAAACYSAYRLIQDDEELTQRKRLKAFHALYEEYKSLPVSCEILLGIASVMSDTDTSADDRVAFIDNALRRKAEWPRLAQLEGLRNQLTAPGYSIRHTGGIIPKKDFTLEISGWRNVAALTLTFTRLDADGTLTLKGNRREQWTAARALIDKKAAPVTYTVTQPAGTHPWTVVQDSLTVKGLPKGVYLVEATPSDKDLSADWSLLYLTDLHLLSQALPGGKTRYAVVSATTGQPVAGAQLEWVTYDRDNRRTVTKTARCDDSGETVQPTDTRRDIIRAYTGTDNCMKDASDWGRFRFSANKSEQDVGHLYTDRALYRPGQQVHAAYVLFHRSKGLTVRAVSGRQVTLTLYDANGQKKGSEEVTTDEFGMASCDFTLPSDGLTGRFSIRANKGNASAGFRVEEYKRPTFTVEIEEYKESYRFGDTVRLKGTAKTYSGVPVQGAKVAYTLSREEGFWWFNRYKDVLDEGETVTDDEGVFHIDMPLALSEAEQEQLADNQHHRLCYRFVADAVVTDSGGESHETSRALPVSNRSVFLECDIDDKCLREKDHTFRLNYRNVAGQDVAATVTYTIDGGAPVKAKSNQDIRLPRLASGRHVMKATVDEETAEKQFIVFSQYDKRPATETHDWFYVSADEFPRDGGPVWLQVGSSDPGQHILYTVIAEDRLLESGVIDQSDALTTRSFTYQEQYGSGLLISFTWVKDGVHYCHSASIRRPMPDKRLNVTWTSFRDRLKPGQQETWTMRVTRSDGTPATAEMLATLYDMSLDQIAPHAWHFTPGLGQNLPYTSWRDSDFPGLNTLDDAMQVRYDRPSLDFTQFNHQWMSIQPPVVFAAANALPRVRIMGAAKMSANVMMKTASMDAADELAEAEMMTVDATGFTSEEDETAENTAAGNQLRRNLQETAFFSARLLTDKSGDVRLTFTLPDCVTTWRLLGFVHDRDMNYALTEQETVAQKTVMVQPNQPRFLRQGDKAVLTSRVMNTSDKDVTGTLCLTLMDAADDKTVHEQRKKFTVGARQTESVSFEVPVENLPDMLVMRFMAEGKDFADGEQHLVAVLPDREYVTHTVPFTQHRAGTFTYALKNLFPDDAADRRLTVEYTNNPAWLMIQALPSLSNPWKENAVSLAAAYYANALGRHIANLKPDIRQIVRQWRQEKGEETSLQSNLEKNEDLKALDLNETPWVRTAQRETAQKQRLEEFFDEGLMKRRISSQLRLLDNLQLQDGSWPWWPGMPGSLYMTVEVSEMLVRLNQMIGQQSDTKNMLRKAFSYMTARMAKEVEQMKKAEKDGVKNPRPSETAVQYLYILSLDGRTLSEAAQRDRQYLVDHLANRETELTIYGKAVAAVILAKNEYGKKAADYLQSIREYTVYKEETGRYFDTRRAYYSWMDYKIPTETAAIEAISMLEPADTLTVEEMQRWLLQEKRTQFWGTPVNAVNAVYGFLGGESGKKNLSLLTSGAQAPARLTVDDTPVAAGNGTAGLGYVKESIDDVAATTFRAEKTSTGSSWGALYGQFFQPATSVSDASSGMTVTREIISDGRVRTGDKVKVRITVQADRDYDFVEIIDKRAACLEPVNQLSGYRYGYYIAPRDNATHYFFHKMAKGKHIVETEYFVDREGTYQTGICTAQSAYSPEFSGRTKASVIQVEKE